MTLEEQARLVELAVKDLREAVYFYAHAQEKKDYKTPRAGYDIPRCYSKESIKRRVTQIRQDLLLLERGL